MVVEAPVGTPGLRPAIGPMVVAMVVAPIAWVRPLRPGLSALEAPVLAPVPPVTLPAVALPAIPLAAVAGSGAGPRLGDGRRAVVAGAVGLSARRRVLPEPTLRRPRRRPAMFAGGRACGMDAGRRTGGLGLRSAAVVVTVLRQCRPARSRKQDDGQGRCREDVFHGLVPRRKASEGCAPETLC